MASASRPSASALAACCSTGALVNGQSGHDPDHHQRGDELQDPAPVRRDCDAAISASVRRRCGWKRRAGKIVEASSQVTGECGGVGVTVFGSSREAPAKDAARPGETCGLSAFADVSRRAVSSNKASE